jgi:hypothetical protein
MRTSYTVIVEMVNEPLRELMLATVARDPHVAKVAAAAPGTMSRPRGAFASRSAADPNQVRVGYQFVSPEYFDVLDIRILHGRGFRQAEASGGAAVTIVSETIARQRWPNGNAVGQILHLDPGTSVIVDPPSGRSGKCPPARCSWSACLATCPASESASSPKRRTSTGRRRRSLRRRT